MAPCQRWRGWPWLRGDVTQPMRPGGFVFRLLGQGLPRPLQAITGATAAWWLGDAVRSDLESAG